MRDTLFQTFVLEQLTGLEEVECRRMFGGFGLYACGTFFGIISQARLYFKTDASTRPDYEQQGMQPFCPRPSQTLKTYYEVPVDVLEDAEQLVAWARQAIASQHAASRPKRQRPPR